MAVDKQSATSILDWPNEAGFQTLHEQHTPISLPIKGTIPAYASGTLYRTGPSSYKVSRSPQEDFACSHWFDGFGQTYRFEIIADEDGSTKVMYNSRRANEQLIEKVRKSGKYGGITFGQRRDPCVGIFGKVMSIFTRPPKPDTGDASLVNVAVTLHPNMPGLPPSQTNSNGKTGLRSLWAATDYSQYKSLSPLTLEPLTHTSQKSLHPLLKGPLSGAHSQTDHSTGDIFNYNLDLGLHPTYRVFKTSASDGSTEILATIQGKAAYIHSFFLSSDYVILAIWSSWYSSNGLSILTSQNLLDAISPFDSSHLTHWYVIDRHHGHGVVAEFESPASFCFHTINSWQETSDTGGTDVLCELVEFENLDILHKFYYENLTSAGKNAVAFNEAKGQSSVPYLARYRLADIEKGKEREGKRDGIRKAKLELTVPKGKVGELPTINPLFSMRSSRYAYGVVNRGYSTFLDGISKVDAKTGEVLYWEEKGCTPGEAIFVPDPEGKEEDEGVLLSVVLDGEKESSFLVCLDAKSLKEVGRAEVGGVVGFGFHGAHVK